MKLVQINASKISRLRSGGMLNVWMPKNYEELQKFVKTKRKYIVLGAMSNVIIPDDEMNAVIIRLNKMNKIYFEQDQENTKTSNVNFLYSTPIKVNINNEPKYHQNQSIQSNTNNKYRVIVDAGVYLKALAIECAKHSYSGLEFFYTIPGTVGGALFMNAGAHGKCTYDCVEWVKVMDLTGEIHTLWRKNIQYEYRSANIPSGWTILQASFFLDLADKNTIMSSMLQFQEYRRKTQPTDFTCGSTFKNPANTSAWKLIKSLSNSDLNWNLISMSSLHANFLHNKGASSNTIKKFILSIQQKVFQKHKILLDAEVVIL